MQKSLMLIVNPYSGKGLSNNALGAIVSSFCDEDYAVTVYTTRAARPEAIAAEYGGNYDLVVCVGGDGTLSGVASGLMCVTSPPAVRLHSGRDDKRCRSDAGFIQGC